MELNDLRDQTYDIGKCAVFYADPVWDGTTNLFAAGGPLTFLGAMEGPVKFAPNPEYSNLTIPEQLGPGILKRYITGNNPTATFGMFPDLAQMKVVSPTGVASLGHERQRLTRALTLWIVPERLFLKNDANGFSVKVPVVMVAGVFLKDGLALTAEEQAMIDISCIVWKGDFTPLTPNFAHADGGKSLTEVDLTAQVDLSRPEGCNQVLVLGEALGDYKVFEIDFEPV